MAANTEARRRKCLHMPLSASDMQPDATLFANRKLFKPGGVGGTRVWQGRFVCVRFKRKWGLPQMSVS